MAKQLITIGTPGAGGGDPAHAAFKKTNDNTNEVYSFLGADGLGVLTAKGAREALNTYSKDEVYSRDEVDNLVENSGFASLDANTFTGKQTMQAGLDVTGGLLLEGKQVVSKNAVSVNYSSPARQRGVTYYNGPNIRFLKLYIGQGATGRDTGIFIGGSFSIAANIPNTNYALTEIIPPNMTYSFEGASDTNFWLWVETDI